MEHVTNESDLGMYFNGPGSKNPGRKRPNAKDSCSKNETMPSIDWTHIKSFPIFQYYKLVKVFLSLPNMHRYDRPSYRSLMMI